MQLLPHIPIFAYQLRNLFLQAIILLHQQLVHRCQFPVHSLEPWRLFSLLLSAPASPKHHKTQKTIQPSMKLKHTHLSWLQTQLKKQTFRPNSPPLLKKITNLSKDINSNRFGNAININIWFKVQTVALTKKERIYKKKKKERKNETRVSQNDTCDSGTRPWSAWARCWREWGTLESVAVYAKSWALGTQNRLARAPQLAQLCTLHTCQHQGAYWYSHCYSLCAAEPQP